MILAVDTSALLLLVNPGADPPDDPETKKPVEHARERVEHFLASMTPADTLIIPTPVLAEALVRAEDGGPGLLEAIAGRARLRVRPFGERAAVETAMMTREAVQAGDKRGGSQAPWQKVKVDRQVIAVARVEAATRIYADDHNLVAFARLLGMDAFSTWDLPVPEQLANLFTAAGVPLEQPAPHSDETPAANLDEAIDVQPVEDESEVQGGVGEPENQSSPAEAALNATDQDDVTTLPDALLVTEKSDKPDETSV